MKKIRFLLLALVALVGINASAKTVYVDPVGNGTWMADNPAISLYVFGDGDGWATSENLPDGVIKFTFDDKFTKMIIVRGPQANANSFDNKWNQTANIEDIQLSKLYKANGYSGDDLAYTVEDYTEPTPIGYTVDFNTSIAVPSNNHSDPMFQVSTGWTRIADRKDGDGYYGTAGYYMRYTYSSSAGVGGTGTLLANAQQAPQSTYDGTIETVYDYIVTPKVSGTVTLQVKGSTSASNTLPSFINFYAVDDDATTVGSEIAATYSADLNTTDFVTVTLTLNEATRIAIRGQWVYMDNFTATSAEVPEVKAITVTSVMNGDGQSGYTGTNPSFEQQPDGTLLVKLKVTIQNTGNVDIVANTAENYTLTLASATSQSAVKTYYEDTPITLTEDLSVGESTTIDVEVAVYYTDTYGAFRYWFVRENLTGTTSSSYRYATSVAYEPIFVFRTAESTATSSISNAEAWGTITESTTKNFEIANTGTAPLTIKSITLPEGFTSDNVPVAEFTLAKGEKQALNITQDASAMGTFAGTLTIVYLDKNATEKTYNLAFSATVIGANTWAADFNGDGTTSSITYPAGSIAEAGISSDYVYNSTTKKYDVYLTGRTTSSYASEDNKFITPKLHANAGDKLAYDVKGVYSSNNAYYAKVYVSTDRVNWGEPVAYYTYSAKDGAEAISNVNWYTKYVEFAEAGVYYVAFALYGAFKIDNLVGLEKVDVAHDLYIKSVSWPDASIKSGASQSKPSVEIIPLTDEIADNYTVKYIYGENEVEIASKALTASPSSTTTFAASFTPSVETTTTFPGTKVVFEFTDGTKFETETFDLTVTNEAIFHFLSSLPSSKWYEPTDYTTPITFGKTNTADSKSFYIYNWGSAPLTVNNISLPEGFTTDTEFPLTVAAFDENDLTVASQPITITFSATAAGIYSGDMVITHSDNETFKLAVSGTKLDPNKFYANFDNPTTSGAVWPAGSVYQGIEASSGNYSAPYNYYLTGTGVFVTPKLTAIAGEKLMFDAKLYNTSWSEGKVVVYAAATRDEVLNAEEGTTRTQLFSVSGKDETNPMTTDYQTFEVPALAGDNYYAFEISDRPYVDEIYGLTVAEVEHDWMIASSNIPTEAMQNVAATATVNILNLGLAEEAADSYTATLYLDGEVAATAETVALPMNHKLSDAGTQLSFSFLSSKVGTFPVYVEVKAGDYSVVTDPVYVTFTEEVFVNDAIVVGTRSSSDRDHAVIDFYNLDNGAKTSDIVYTQDQLEAFGIKAGDKITALSFIGTISSAKTISNSLTAWVGMKTGDITWNSPDKTNMTEVTIFDGTMAFAAGSNEIKIDLSTNPITYDGNSDLRIYFEGTKGGWASLSFDYDNNYKNMKWSNASSMKSNPLLYVTVDAAPATLAGTVKTSGREAIANATVTLKAENGVQYSGKTDAEGNYSFNVVQAGLDFTVTVEAENYIKKEFAYSLGGESKTLNVTLYESYGLVGTFPGFDWSNDQVMTRSTEDPNIFTFVVEDVELEATKYEYKLRADGIWQNSETNDGYELPSSGNNEKTFYLAGTYTLKFTANVSEHTLTLEPTFILEKNAAVIAGVAENTNLDGVNIVSERQIKAGWNAIYLPVYVSAEEVTALFGDNAEIAYYAGDDADASSNVTVKFGKRGEGSIEAGVPYLLWSENEVNGFELTGHEIKADKWSTTGTTFDFVGVYTTTDANAGDYFIAGGKFVKATTNNTVKPFRSYLKAKGAGVRSVTFIIGEEATEIEGLTVERDYANDAIYNLNGQKVQQPTKRGLYIINGKKVMVK